MLPQGIPSQPTSHPAPSSSPPGRPSRLRGLSYLRNYTHHHSNSHSHAAPTIVTAANASTSSPTQVSHRTSTGAPVTPTAAQRSSPPPGSTNNRSSTGAAQPATTWVVTNPSTPSAEPTSPSLLVANGQPTSSSATTGTTTTNASPVAVIRPRTDSIPLTQVRSIDEALAPATPPAAPSGPAVRSPNNNTRNPNSTENFTASIRFTPFQDVRSPREALTFPPIERILRRGDEVIRVGRYSERDVHPYTHNPNNTTAPVGFKSKVVSRRHCDFWCDNGQWYVKDVKSSSGTFLNHIRLSSPGIESRAYPIHDGDILQLGIDFKGGEEPIFRCVKIRVELNRAWQKGLNNFNMSAHKRLRIMADKSFAPKGDTSSLHTSECSICLMSVAPCQALFVAPCSHVWHYKCIKPLVDKSYPTFLCPNCRAIADLGKDIEEDELYQVMRELEQENQNRAQDTPSEDDEGGDEQNPELDRLDEGESAVGDALTEVGPRNDEDGTGSNLDYQQHLPSSRASDTREQQSTPTREQQRNRQQQYQDSQTPLTTDDSDEGPGRIGTGGPMTPMNDAGPFVFDGEGPRNLGSRGRRESRG